MIEFTHHRRAQSAIGVSSAVLASVIGIGFVACWNSFFPLFFIAGVCFCAIAAFLWRSVRRRDEWRLQIDSGVLSWDYPGSSPGASGSVDLTLLESAVIDDNSACLHVFLKSGAERKIELAVSGYLLSQHLLSHYPGIKTEYKASVS